MGDHVAEDEVVLEIETDKTSVQVPSPGNGIIEEMLAKDGDTVKAGQPLFKIKITGDAPPAKKTTVSQSKSASPPMPTPKPKPVAVNTAPKVDIPVAPKPPIQPVPAPTPSPAASPSQIPVAAIRHAQTIDAATLRVCSF